MAQPLTHSPDVTYATKPNILYPGKQAAATAAEARANARLADGFPSLDIEVKSGSIKPSD